MTAAKKKDLLKYPANDKKPADTQENLRLVKMEAEKLRNELQKRILDNPKIAKKAALLVSLWAKNDASDKKKRK